ncbi:MAG: hypothetical protein IV090_23800 [Candidatus Sericytochromatia bacterium]|nr:hypothetical protein [Candidatus Sericytochromatia bacterium]
MARAFLSEDNPFHILVPVWGENYTETFLNYLVPSLLAEGNLPAWPYSAHTVLQIATRQEDALQMEASPFFQRLRHFVPIQFQIFEFAQFKHLQIGQAFEAKYQLLNDIMGLLLQQAMAVSAHVIPLVSDVVLADNFFSYLRQALEAETVLLLMAGPRLALTAKNSLETGRKNGTLALSPRQLNQRIFSDLHPHEQACFIDAPVFSQWPSHVYYWQNPRLVISRWFHLHPFFLYCPQVVQGQRTVSIEADLLNQYQGRREQIRLIQESETAACSVSTLAEDMPAWGKQSSLSERQQMLLDFGEHKCLPLQRWFFGHSIAFRLDN